MRGAVVLTIDWTTVATFATAIGTLVLAVATFAAAADVIAQRGRFTVELLYGDYEGGQRMVSRFGFAPRKDGKWFVSASRHWNIDRPDPR